jgi:hypothetical protein
MPTIRQDQLGRFDAPNRRRETAGGAWLVGERGLGVPRHSLASPAGWALAGSSSTAWPPHRASSRAPANGASPPFSGADQQRDPAAVRAAEVRCRPRQPGSRAAA